jgi:hypothetical protein
MAARAEDIGFAVDRCARGGCVAVVVDAASDDVHETLRAAGFAPLTAGEERGPWRWRG